MGWKIEINFPFLSYPLQGPKIRAKNILLLSSGSEFKKYIYKKYKYIYNVNQLNFSGFYIFIDFFQFHIPLKIHVIHFFVKLVRIASLIMLSKFLSFTIITFFSSKFWIFIGFFRISSKKFMWISNFWPNIWPKNKLISPKGLPNAN